MFIIQELIRPEVLFSHLFAGDAGFLVTASAGEGGWQQDYWRYPDEAQKAAADVIEDAQRGRDCYFGIHLYRERGNRLSANALPTVRALWSDIDDGGRYPEEGPQPTAIIHSSAGRFHPYWRLTRSIPTAWAVDLNRRIATWANADMGKAGLSTVLRCAGTCNCKREKPELVGGYLTGVEEWEPEVIDQAVPVLRKLKPNPRRHRYDGPAVHLAPYLENVEILREIPDSLGIKYQIICPWVGQHSGGDRSGTRVGQLENGAVWFRCDHRHCEGRRWREFARKVGHTTTVNVKPPGASGPDLGLKIHYDR